MALSDVIKKGSGVPPAGSLIVGGIGVDSANGKIYIKKDDNTVVSPTDFATTAEVEAGVVTDKAIAPDTLTSAGIVTSVGAADKDRLVKTGADGLIDSTVLPVITPPPFKGEVDMTKLAPIAPTTGDYYINSQAGTVHNSWIGIGGSTVNLHDSVIWDGRSTTWVVLANATDLSTHLDLAGLKAMTGQITVPTQTEATLTDNQLVTKKLLNTIVTAGVPDATATVKGIAVLTPDATATVKGIAVTPRASTVTSTPAGNIVATSVQAAINELDTEKVSKAGDTLTGQITVPTQTTVASNMLVTRKFTEDNATSFATPAEVTAGTVADKAIAPNTIASAGIATTTGIVDKDKLVKTNSIGVLAPELFGAIDTSAGSADGGKPVMTNASGIIDMTMLTGISGNSFKGETDVTAVAPTSPDSGDYYINSKAGTAHTSWAGVTITVNLHDMLIWDGSGSTWVVIASGTDFSAYLDLAGVKPMTGQISVPSQTEAGLADNQLVTKKLASTLISTATPDATATVKGIAVLPTAATTTFTPVGDIVATNVQAMGEELDAEKLSLTGGTVTGQIKGIAPVDDEVLTRKKYVDEHFFRGDGTPLPFDGTDRVFSISESGVWIMANYTPDWATVGYPTMYSSNAWTEITIHDSWGHQKVWGYKSAAIYTRILDNGVWGAWVQTPTIAMVGDGLDLKVDKDGIFETDLDSITDSGFFRIGDPASDHPSSADYGQLISSVGLDTAAQIIVSFESNRMWIRGGQGMPNAPVWSDWAEMASHDKVARDILVMHAIIDDEKVAKIGDTLTGQLTVPTQTEAGLVDNQLITKKLTSTLIAANVPASATATVKGIAVLPTGLTTTLTPAGNILATNVQAGIEELDAEKVPKTGVQDTGDWNGVAYVDPDAVGANPVAKIYPDGSIVGKTANGKYVKYANGELLVTLRILRDLRTTDAQSYPLPIHLTIEGAGANAVISGISGTVTPQVRVPIGSFSVTTTTTTANTMIGSTIATAQLYSANIQISSKWK